MQKLLKTIALLALGFPSTFASASILGWGMWGSEVIKDLNNPWFVKDKNGKTYDVHYCVQTKQDNISLPYAQLAVPTLIASAFLYWKNDFQSAIDENETSVSKHSFKLDSHCNEKTDIVFYIGELPEKIKEQIPNLKQTIALTVRTDYDTVNLRGKGFVYIAPDRGENSLSIHNPELMTDPWASQFCIRGLCLGGGLLQKVIAHEIGHILGLPHADPNAPFSYFNIMNAHFGEFILDKNFPNELRSIFSIPVMLGQLPDWFPQIPLYYFPYFPNDKTSIWMTSFSGDYTNGEERKGIRKVFDLPADENLNIEIGYDHKSFILRTFREDEDDRDLTVDYTTPWQTLENAEPMIAGSIRITNKNQVIFPFVLPDEDSLLPTIEGPMMRTYIAKTIFQNPQSGLRREVGLRSFGGSYVLSSIGEKGLIPDLISLNRNINSFTKLKKSMPSKKQIYAAMAAQIKRLQGKAKK